MRKPTPMTGKGRSRIEKELWKLRYDKDSKLIERAFYLSKIDYYPILPCISNENSIVKKEEKTSEFLLCNKEKKKKKKYTIKDFFLAIIFFFCKLVKTSWFIREFFFF